MMTSTELSAEFAKLRVHQQEGHGAVYKPLLALLMLGRHFAGNDGALSFEEYEGAIKPVLDDCAPRERYGSRHYPFWHLQTDGLWELEGPDWLLNRSPGATPNIGEFRTAGAAGRFRPDIALSLAANRALIPPLARQIAETWFPQTVIEEVLAAVGLPLVGSAEGLVVDSDNARRRDPKFRPAVLLAYQGACCVCGHDLKVGGQTVGLEAAHIRWFQRGGPDSVENGLALCSVHHKLYDLGVFTIRPDSLMIEFSKHALGSSAVTQRLLDYHGEPICTPDDPAERPSDIHLSWHVEELFREPARFAETQC